MSNDSYWKKARMAGMTPRYIWNWVWWIAIDNGVYCFLYTISPLNQYGLLWITYVSFPIFFLSGGKTREVPNYALSSVVGVLWALVFIKAIGWFAGLGLSAALATGVGVLIVEFVLIYFHFMLTMNTWLNAVPAIFGGVAVTFSQGGQNILPIMITLVLGVLVVTACVEGARLLTSSGHWKMFKRSTAKTQPVTPD